jgi:hypothetical protein
MIVIIPTSLTVRLRRINSRAAAPAHRFAHRLFETAGSSTTGREIASADITGANRTCQ